MQSIIPLNLSWRAGNQNSTIPTQNTQFANSMQLGNKNNEFLQSLVSQIDMEIQDICISFIDRNDLDKVAENDLEMLKTDILSKISTYINKYKENLKGSQYPLSSLYEKSHYGEIYKTKSYVDVTKHAIEISPLFVLNIIRYLESNIEISS